MEQATSHTTFFKDIKLNELVILILMFLVTQFAVLQCEIPDFPLISLKFKTHKEVKHLLLLSFSVSALCREAHRSLILRPSYLHGHLRESGQSDNKRSRKETAKSPRSMQADWVPPLYTPSPPGLDRYMGFVGTGLNTYIFNTCVWITWWYCACSAAYTLYIPTVT